MIKLITILFFIFYFNNLNAQDWLKKSVPADLNHTCLIIEKIDSIGKKCKDGKKLVYCHDFEKNIDKQLSSLQNIQETSFQNYKHDYILVLPKAFPYQEFTDLKDVNKYRYILKMHYHPPTNEKDNFPIWMYYFYLENLKSGLVGEFLN